MTDTAKPARKRGRVSLRVSLIAIMLGTVALTSAAVHIPWLLVSRQNVADIAGQLNAEIIGGVNREVSSMLDSAIAAQSALHDTLIAGGVDFEDKSTRDRLLFAFLKAHPHFSWVSFGAPNGDFFGAQRRDDIHLRLVESRWNEALGEAARTEVMYLKDGAEFTRTGAELKQNKYYAPDRAWYKRAVWAPGHHVWTDIYIFSDSRKPGLNSAITLENLVTGELLGVITIAIELEQISLYLSELSSVRSGAAFIIDRSGDLIAFSDPGELVQRSRLYDESDLQPLAQSRHPMLQLAQAGFVENGVETDNVTGRQQMTVKAANGERYFLTVAPTVREGWLLGTLIPEADFMGAIEANYIRLALIVAAALFVVGLIALLVSRHLLVRPLQRLAVETGKIAGFNLDDVRMISSPLIEIQALADAVEQMSHGLRSFRRYIPTDLVRTLLQHGGAAEIGGERRTMTIVFMDLQGFTTVSERLGHRVLPVLGDYFGAMTTAIRAQRGTIDKFIGDGVMAFWGAPAHEEDHPALACRAALDCQAAMDKLRAEWTERGLPQLHLRIGVNSGRVVVGNVGSEERLNYTVIGDPVNLAARLEGMNRQFGTGILISQYTYEMVKYDMLARPLESVRVKGKEEAVMVYELLAARDDDGVVAGFEWVQHYEAGFKRYAEGDWSEAARHFRLAIEQRGGDTVSEDYLERTEHHMAVDPAPAFSPSAAIVATGKGSRTSAPGRRAAHHFRRSNGADAKSGRPWTKRRSR